MLKVMAFFLAYSINLSLWNMLESFNIILLIDISLDLVRIERTVNAFDPS